METHRRLVIAGGSGFLGRSLVRAAAGRFEDVVVLSRSAVKSRDGVRVVQWDARSAGPWEREIDGATAIVNFVGRTVDCIKTEENRREILESRVNSVAALAGAVARAGKPPAVWVQSGTAHIFGDTGDEVLDDNSPIGSGFAPVVGQAWERAFFTPAMPSTRRVMLRISFVLGRDGGALTRLGALARWFLGGTVGSGRQWISWLHERDLSRLVLRAIDDRATEGTYVATSPHPVTNREFMRELRSAVGRPWSPPAPAWAVKIAAPMLLRTDPELALLGRRVVPSKLMAAGFEFEFATLREALTDIYRPVR